MNTAANFVQQQTGRDIRLEPRVGIHPHMWLQHPLIAEIYNETKRWQGQPNRQDPITKAMIAWLRQQGVGLDKDGFINALVDWLIIGLNTGYRSIEWCQDDNPNVKGFYQYETPGQFDNLTYACCPGDFNFVGHKANLLSAADDSRSTLPPAWQVANAHPVTAFAATEIRWRYQKNLEHGEKIEFVANTIDPNFCPVIATKNIVDRHKRLRDDNSPLAVYRKHPNSKRASHFIKASVQSRLRLAAWKVYYPELAKQSDSPAKITLHSVRIGACVLLHSVKPDPLFIKNRLRWKSNKFERYLRHVPVLAAQHGHIWHTADISSYALPQHMVG